MLSSFKSSKAAEQDGNTAANAGELTGRTVQPSHTVVEQVAPRPEPTTTRKSGPDSCIGSGMSIVGNIECNGPAQVFGRIEGELRASDLLIGEGSTIDGSVIAQNVTVCGRIKGTIRAVRVKLQNGGAVEGDIFHRSLSIDENSLFEGSSRRVENPTEIPSSIDAKVPRTTDIQSATPMSNIDADLQRVESARTDWSEPTVGPKH
jgi:cytoskeletal protein CcmA (bactofilin family)